MDLLPPSEQQQQQQQQYQQIGGVGKRMTVAATSLIELAARLGHLDTMNLLTQAKMFKDKAEEEEKGEEKGGQGAAIMGGGGGRGIMVS